MQNQYVDVKSGEIKQIENADVYHIVFDFFLCCVIALMKSLPGVIMTADMISVYGFMGTLSCSVNFLV